MERTTCLAQVSGVIRNVSNSGRVSHVAVVGAGIAGAVCSHLLAQRGAKVDVFDLGRQFPGGRASSRIPSPTTPTTRGGGNTENASPSSGPGPRPACATAFQFDYGCQFFAAPSSPVVKRLLQQWLVEGVVAEWRPRRQGVYDVARGVVRPCEELTDAEARGVAASGLPPLPSPGSPLYVGLPSMAALVAHVLAYGGRGGGDITLRLNTRVHRAWWSGSGWLLEARQAKRGAGDGGGGGGCEGAVARSAGQQPQQAAGGSRPRVTAAASSQPESDSELDLSGQLYDALVITDSQVARPGAPGHVELHGAPPSLEALTARMRTLTRLPQFALLLGWAPGEEAADAAEAGVAGATARPPPLPADALHVLGGAAVQWLANDSSKPGRQRADGGQCWVVLTRPDFAASILHRGPHPGPPAPDTQEAHSGSSASVAAAVAASPPPASPEYRSARAADIWGALQSDLRGLLGPAELPPPTFMTAHRWSSSYTAVPGAGEDGAEAGRGLGQGQPALWNSSGRWAACGDFCNGPGFESAAASGAAAAEAVADMLGLPPNA